jgi:hypothetical protein
MTFYWYCDYTPSENNKRGNDELAEILEEAAMTSKTNKLCGL